MGYKTNLITLSIDTYLKSMYRNLRSKVKFVLISTLEDYNIHCLKCHFTYTARSLIVAILGSVMISCVVSLFIIQFSG